MPATKEAWLTTTRVPLPPSYPGMLEFFGIPPYNPENLDDNIARKRREWYAKTSSGNPRGRAKAKEVVDLIQEVSKALKRGSGEHLDGGTTLDEVPDEVFHTLEELWNLVTEYVLANDFDPALRLVRDGTSRFGPEAVSGMLAWVVATGVETASILNPETINAGVAAAARATRSGSPESRDWESLVTLLFAAGRGGEAEAALGQAERTLPALSPRLHLRRAQAFLAHNRVQDGLVSVVSAVHGALGDPYGAEPVRSLATDLLVGWIGRNMLPIRSAEALAAYIEMVDTAAWCADGVPEAEDKIRAHRMWAANAGQRVFAGSWTLRSFLAVCTGFISLPIHNRMRSEPAWAILLRGPRAGGDDPAYQLVCQPRYVQVLHQDLPRR
jgi:hypothetical protein